MGCFLDELDCELVVQFSWICTTDFVYSPWVINREMRRITFANRTQKDTGTVKLRFRLRDGRNVQLFHKSGIKASLKELERFTTDCQVRKNTKIYNATLQGEINAELEVMNQAYDRMVAEGKDMTSEVFETIIKEIRNPVEEERSGVESLVTRFRRYADESLRDGIIGLPRHAHFVVFAGKLERYVIIKGISRIVPSEVTPDFLMDFRNFLFDEYKYVKKHPTLYRDMNRANKPTERLGINTVSTQMKILQTFFNHLEENDEIIKSPFRKLGKERKAAVVKTMYDDPFFLRAEEFDQVRKAKLPPNLESVRKAFVLQCALGCRISDFKAMTMDNVSVSDEGIPFIHYLPQKTADTQKTNKEIQTPLVRFAFDIVKETGFDFPELKYVYGAYGYNNKIRKLLQISKIERAVPIYDEKKRKNEYQPLWTLGSTKLCRKTHVDIMNKVQIDKYVTGLHRKGSAAVNRYTNLELRDLFKLMNAAFKQKAYKVDEQLNII